MQKTINILGACALFLLPFVGGNHLPLHFFTVDRFWIETSFAFVLASCSVAVFLLADTRMNRLLPFFVLAGPYILINLLSLAYSWDLFATIKSINVLLLALAMACVASFMDRGLVIRSLVVGGLVLAACAIVQHCALFPSLRTIFTSGQYAALLGEQSSIPFGSYLYHNIMGGYLAFLFPLSIFLAASEKPFAWAPISATIIIGVVLSSSRIALTLVVIIVGICGVAFFIKRKFQQALIVFVVCALAAGGTFLLLKLPGTPEATTVQKVLEEKVKTAGSQLSTMNTRTDIWKNGLEAFRHHPIVGVGAGSFEFAYRKYFYGNSYTRVAHSTLLKTAVELGVIGLLCLIIYLVEALLHLRGTKWGFGDFALIAACGCGFAFGLVDFSFDVPSHVITFFALSSMLFVDRRAPLRSVTQTDGAARHALFLSRHKLVALAMMVALLLSLTFTFRAALADKALENGGHLEDLGLTADAVKSYEDADHLMPWNAEGALRATAALTGAYLSGGGKEAGNVIGEKLTMSLDGINAKRTRNSEAFLISARGYVALGKTGEADNAFRAALSLYPTSAYYVSEFLDFSISTNQLDQAERLVRTFAPLKPKYVGPYNTRGLYVYRIQDLEATLAYKRGDRQRALEIARNNLQDAKENKYVITSARARQFVERKSLIEYMQQRIISFETAPEPAETQG